MQKRKTIAVDVDDVLAASLPGWVAYSNQTWGLNLTLDDYQEDWARAWGVGYRESERRAALLHDSGVMDTYATVDGARAVLEELAGRYRLVVTTSRLEVVREATMAWLERYYDGIFAEVYLAGLFDNQDQDLALELTKADLHRTVGADYVIDDQPKHCLAAAAAGIEALLFGDYSWNRDIDRLPGKVTWCRDWAAVKEYFDGRD